jgi:hypothetical protein
LIHWIINYHVSIICTQIPTAAGGHMNMLFLTNTQAADFDFSGL